MLGKGSFGNVYLVKKQNKEYALKRIDLRNFPDIEKYLPYF
jgi:hypothetical protein